ncbi:AraC family transcriptional regulator [Paenibacillus sp. TAB 01]|uniref:AraC family transcriptional regulator n=1 Tax=Paenibacillus sp. TAB 01 TaxID=3368988 RepID=UPI0037509F26
MNRWKPSLRGISKQSLFQKRLYRKSLIAILLAICLPTIIVGSGVKWIGTKQLQDMVLTSRNHQVVQSAQRVDDSLSYLEKAATQWAFNREFGMKLKTLETSYDFEFIRNIYTDLLLLKESNPLIEQVYLYLDRPSVAFSDSSGTIELNAADKSPFHTLLSNGNSAFWLSAFRTAAHPGKELPALVFQLPAESAEPFGALVVYLNPAQVTQMLNGATLDENGAAFLVNEQGNPVGSSMTAASPPQAVQASVLNQIHIRKKASGSFVYDTEQGHYSVSYASFKRLGKSWTYMTIDSLDKLNSPVIAASNFVYAIGFIGLLICIAAALIVSRKLYQPIQGLLKVFRANPGTNPETSDEIEFITEQWQRLNFESRTLEQRLQDQLPTMKEGFFLQLLQGRFQSSKRSQLEERMEWFGWDTGNLGYAVFGIQFHGASQANARFREGDQELISFAAVNITEEVMKESPFKSEIINLHDQSVSVLLGCPLYDPFDERTEELYRLAERLVGALQRFLQLNTTVSISKMVASVIEIPQAWDEVNRIVRYRDLNESRQVINAEDFHSLESNAVRYPFAAEMDILQAIRSADEKEAYRALEQFCLELKRNTTKEYVFQQGVLQLFGNLQFGFLKAGYNPFETDSFDLREELARKTETSEIVSLFNEHVIRRYIERVVQDSEKQDVRLKHAIDSIVESIHTRYDADLSLDLFAEEHNVTSLTLSKSFKKQTGVNFIQYLTEVRLRKAKELLAETDYRINDIAEMVGYQPTYFNRIFKKSEGITPSQYRDLTLVEAPTASEEE